MIATAPAPIPIQRETSSCPLCGESSSSSVGIEDEPLLSGNDRLHDLPGEFTIVRCPSCRLMRTNPRPTPESMGFYYPSDYGPYQSTIAVEAAPVTRQGPRPLWKRIARRLIEFNTERLPDRLTPGRALEIGCASGSFLRKLDAAGWDAEGIEFSPVAAEAARRLGYRVFTGAVENAPEPSAPYDLVVGWMVLEHLHDPVLALRKLHRWVRPGGWIALSVPNAASLEFSLFRQSWFALQLPTHTYHYTPKTIARVLAHGGWALEKVHHQRVLSNWVGSVGIALKQTPRTARLGQSLIDSTHKPTRAHLLLYPLAWALSLIGQTGRMTVWARRIDD